MSASTPRLRHAGFFVLRSPLLPFAAIDGITRERLRELIARPEVREALFVASPSLVERIPEWLERPESESGMKVEQSLLRYTSRMATRSTPFGLFAGCAVGKVAGESSELRLAALDTYRRHTRLDMDYVSALVERLARDPGLRETLRYRRNSSVYRVGGRVHYAEARVRGSARNYSLVAVDDSDALKTALARAEGDGASLHEIAEALVHVYDELTLDEARAFAIELVDAQLLVPTLEATVTGAPPLARLVAQLEGRAEAAPLARVHEALVALDRAPPGAPLATYRALADELRALPAPVEANRLFQVDMCKPGDDARLGADVIDELVRGVDLLHRLAPDREELLTDFRDRFRARYEDREVPLAEALDEELGIGFEGTHSAGNEGSPLLEGLPFGRGAGSGDVAFTRRDELLLERLRQVWISGARELSLTDADIAALARTPRHPLPGSFAVLATVAEDPQEIFLQCTTGPSSGDLLGRFCHADPVLEEAVRSALRDEEALAPEAIFAEVVHLPQNRIGNILARPVLRDYEIAFLGGSGAPTDKQITIDDLHISVRGDRIVLRSARLNREVLPRLTTAHNFTSPANLGTYRFLCALKLQGVVPSVSWSWGALRHASFLPRVKVGRLVLARARWRLEKAELATLADTSAKRIGEMRLRHGWPRWIEVVDGDNHLAIDLDNALSVATLAKLVGGRDSAELVEMWPAPERLACRGPEGAYAHELVVPFTQGAPLARAARPPSSPTSTPAPARAFAPGSEWLYAKLYTGPGRCDGVLREVVAPLVRAALASGESDAWFFLRYGDPDWHVRLRLRGLPQNVARLHAVTRPLLDDGTVHRVVLDTYKPETERYGGVEGLALSERLFQADSEAAVAMMERLTPAQLAQQRWKVALRGMDATLGDLGFELSERLAIATRCRDQFAAEFRVDAAFQRALGARFRSHRAELEALLAGEADGILAAVWSARAEAIAPVGHALRAATLDRPLADIAESYLHMHANRVLRSAARAQELVLYDFLVRLYESRAARSRKRA